MSLFSRRSKLPADSNGVAEILLQGRDMMERSSRAHAGRWGLGTADGWDLDQQTSVIRWTFPDKAVEAPAQVLATYSPNGHTWMWAWANRSLLPALLTASEEVRAWGHANGQSFLTQPTMDASPEQADDMAAVAFRLTRATGFYRPPAGSSVLYLTFGAVIITPHDGHPEEFTINLA